MPIFDDEKQKNRLQQIHEKEEEELIQTLARRHKLPYANLMKMSIDLDGLKMIPENKAREAKMAIFQLSGTKLQIGVRQPDNILAQSILKDFEEQEYRVQIFLVSMTSLERTWKRYAEIPSFEQLSKGVVDISSERVGEFLKQIINIDDLKALFLERTKSKESRRISELIEILLSSALQLDSSDIHIEPRDSSVHLRLRLDGVLHDVLDFDHKSHQLIISRIKLVSEMKLNIKDKPQDGRFTIRAKDIDVEIRTSILPGPYGESIVLRVLNPKTISVSFQDLGMHPTLRNLMEKEIKKPNGMILTTGPTGSGKTTTLYAFLKKLKSPGTKIITLEEPIEYRLEGITQTQTNPNAGYTFASGLRAILRQDPDIIMVGEIRDLEAAQIALNSALTGHLVFSTLHTNDAYGTIPRLIDLGANPAIIAPALNVSMAQRLVRKLCPECKKEHTPTEKELKIIEAWVNNFPKGVEKPDIKAGKLFEPVGCIKCQKIGYKGRLGIFEAFLVHYDDRLEKIIMENPTMSTIRKLASDQPILNMQQDAIVKILEGVTTFEEVNRVIEMEKIF